MKFYVSPEEYANLVLFSTLISTVIARMNMRYAYHFVFMIHYLMCFEGETGKNFAVMVIKFEGSSQKLCAPCSQLCLYDIYSYII